MTRINGKGPKPPMRLSLIRQERTPDYSAALFEVVGGAQDGASLAVSVTHPGGRPMLAVQSLIGLEGRVLAEGALDPVQALAMLPATEPQPGDRIPGEQP